MNLVCVIRKGPHLAHTLSSVLFDYHGKRLSVPYVICDNWAQGLTQAQQSFDFGLFVDSGTVFYDLESFVDQLKNYPHQGLIAHIIDNNTANVYYSLHPQCFFLKLDQYTTQDLVETTFTNAVTPVRSEKNIHHNHTPLWLKPSRQKAPYNFGFGSQLVNTTLDQGKIVVNFSHELRTKKKYLYDNESVSEWINFNQEYIDLAKNQLWIFNNEPVNYNFTKTKIICPASGFFWLQAAQCPTLQDIVLIDISSTQVKFAKTILQDWNGVDYGGLVLDFMRDNNLMHYCLDREITKLERLQLANKDKLRNYINQHAPTVNLDMVRTKNVQFKNQCIVQFAIQHDITNSHVWMSNILDYKLTYLSYTFDFIEQFKLKVADHII